MLRDHDIFRGPFSIDDSQKTTVPLPADWKGALNDETIDVFPLVSDSKRRQRAGWCTYVNEHATAPELEFCCGGINGKSPQAGAIWRQGNLMHFGFEQSPAEMNEIGRTLLVNAITYIWRFTEDRPIIQTPSPFAPKRHRIFDRDAIGRLVRNNSRELKEYLRFYASPDLYQELQGKSREELGDWFKENRPWIRAGENGTLELDEQARSFGEGPAEPAFFDKAIQALDEPENRRDLARKLLERYTPDGPSASGSRDAWTAWHSQNRSYLFFSDSGGYRWYIDPLAKSRKTPTDKLRGSDRASRPAIALRADAGK